MARERGGDEPARLHVFDEPLQVLGGVLAACLRQSHRLADHHEPLAEQAQAADAGGVGLELLPDAGRDVDALRDEGVDDRLRRRRADDRRVLQLAREMQVVGAALADDDDVAGAVDLVVAAQRRAFANEVAALDQDIGRGERDVGAAQRVDGEEADVGALLRDRLDRLAGGVDGQQLDGDAEAPAELLRQVDRDAARGAGRRVAAGEDRIAEVDGGAQRSGRREAGDDLFLRAHVVSFASDGSRDRVG